MKSEYPKYYIPTDECWNKNLICFRLNYRYSNRKNRKKKVDQKKVSMTHIYKNDKSNDYVWEEKLIKDYVKNYQIKEISECEAALLI